MKKLLTLSIIVSVLLFACTPGKTPVQSISSAGASGAIALAGAAGMDIGAAGTNGTVAGTSGGGIAGNIIK